MPELASIKPNPPQGSCPSTEDLSCYIDGALSPEEAVRVTEHLASCESCFEVYSDVLQFQLESEPEPRGKVVPFLREKRLPPVAWWSSIAALLVLGFFGWQAVDDSRSAAFDPLVTAQVTAQIHGKPALWLGETMRGGGEDGETAPVDEASFRMGVQIVNLQVLLNASDREGARNIISYILKVLNAQDLNRPLNDSYTSLGVDIDRAKDARELLPRAARLAQESRDYFEPLYLDLGQWVEAGRLAAISHDPAFFRLPEAWSFLRHTLRRDWLGFKDSKLPMETRRQLEAIYKIAGKDTLQSTDFAKLQSHFEHILQANYPR